MIPLGRGFTSALVALCVVAGPSLAQPSEPSLPEMANSVQENPTDEAVRRIVERAMAAVALAEAQATRSIAEVQVRLIEKTAEADRLQAQVRLLGDSIARVRSERDSALAAVTAADRRAIASNQEAASMRAELERMTPLLASAQSLLARMEPERNELRDSAARLGALLNRSEATRLELSGRIEEMHTRVSLLEQAYAEARAEADSLRLAAGSGERVSADSLAAAEMLNEGLQVEVQRLRDRIDGYRSRSAILEEGIKRESERSAALEVEYQKLVRIAAESAAQVAADRAAWEADRASVIASVDSVRSRLTEAEASASAAAGERDLARGEIVRLREEMERIRRESAGASREELQCLEESRARAEAERDSFVAELIAIRREVIETIRVVRESGDALRRARAERDAALARSGTDTEQVANLTRRLAEAEREVAALRDALAVQVAATPAAPPTRPGRPGRPGSRPTTPPAQRPGTPSASPRPADTRAVVATPPVAPTPAAPSTPSVSTPPSSPPVTVAIAPPAAPVVPAATAAASAASSQISALPATTPSSAPARVDLNSATQEQLALVPLIGETRARALIWFRENVRPIRNEEDLKSVPGFNDERIRALREFTTLNP